MMKIYWSSGIIFILCGFCFSSIFGSGSKKLIDSNIEKRSITSANSLLSSIELEDDGEAVDADENVKLKKIQRKSGFTLQLPEGYNKLEVPVMKLEHLLRKQFGENATDMLANLSGEDEWSSEETDANEIGQVPLDVYILLRSIREIDEIKEEITVELDFLVSWLDMHLCIANDCEANEALRTGKGKLVSKSTKSIDPIFLRKIWKPDLLIENVVEISRPELIMKPVKLLYTPSGFIKLQTRIILKMDCEMKFHYYPADTQHCVFRIRSYSHTTKELRMVWNIDEAHSRHGVFIEDRGENNFDVKIDSVTSSEKTEWEGLLDTDYSEKYTILEFHVSCRRKLSYHLIQTYLPSIFFIIITWLCFLIPGKMVEARIGISMTTLLTLTSMFASVRESTPVVSYVKAIDIWMVACIFSVFLTLLEFTILIWLRHSHEEEDENSSTNQNGCQKCSTKRKECKDNDLELETLEPLNKKQNSDKVIVGFCTNTTKSSKVKIGISNWIEKHAFLIFSIIFLIFNISYWLWLLHSSEYFNWEVDPLYNSDDNDN